MRQIILFLIFSLFIVACNDNVDNSMPKSTRTYYVPTLPATTLISYPAFPDIDSAGLPNNKVCLKSFQEFAYSFWDLKDEVENVQINLPTSPWKVDAVIQSEKIDGFYPPYRTDLALVRSKNEGQEIWIAQDMLSTSSSPGGKTMFVIYKPVSRSWMTVSANIENTKYYVSDLFLTRDGSVWGSTAGEYYKGDFVPAEKIPVLSKFNEYTQRFEFVSGMFGITPTIPDDPKLAWFSYFDNINIVLDDKREVFWIFVQKDGIYRYELTKGITQKWVDVQNLQISSNPIMASDGSIYIEDFRWEEMKEPYFHLYQGALLHFIPDTKELVSLEMPDEPWPIFSGWLITQTGRLWLGTIGYRELDGTWHILHPNPNDYFKRGGEQTASPPYLMLESSDGRLWYKKYLDMGPRYEGTAWYNPKTGEGCMFTNLAVNIIEDSQHQLWLVADGKLYKYSLRP